MALDHISPGSFNHTAGWIAYMTGAVLAFGARFLSHWARYAREQKMEMYSCILKAALSFIGTTATDVKGTRSGVSWVTTIGIVWMLGGIVVSHGVHIMPAALQAYVPHLAVDFVIGSLAEAIAPPIGEWIVSRIVGMVKGGK